MEFIFLLMAKYCVLMHGLCCLHFIYLDHPESKNVFDYQMDGILIDALMH